MSWFLVEHPRQFKSTPYREFLLLILDKYSPVNLYHLRQIIESAKNISPVPDLGQNLKAGGCLWQLTYPGNWVIIREQSSEWGKPVRVESNSEDIQLLDSLLVHTSLPVLLFRTFFGRAGCWLEDIGWNGKQCKCYVSKESLWIFGEIFTTGLLAFLTNQWPDMTKNISPVKDLGLNLRAGGCLRQLTYPGNSIIIREQSADWW